MTNKERIFRHLQFIYPEEATILEIESATGVSPHSQVYQKTQQLFLSGKITGRQVGRTWYFKAKSVLGEEESANEEAFVEQEYHEETPASFEALAQRSFSKIFQTPLTTGTLPDVPKKWDMVSEGGSIVGDAKYYTLVGGKRLPPAKFATIAEHVWLLEKTDAKIKFLVFGNQIEVPTLWLNKYGHLVNDVQFYFLDEAGNVKLLNSIQRTQLL